MQGIGPEIYPFIGLSTEAKPREAYAGQRAIETDTKNIYQWFGDTLSGSWVLIVENGSALVFLGDQIPTFTRDGQERVLVSDQTANNTLESILVELKLIKMQLSFITEEKFETTDIEE